MKLLLDTHIWIWLVGGDDRLGASTRERLASALDELWLSPISSWEPLLLAERARVTLGPDPISWVRRESRKPPLREVSLTHDVALASRTLETVGKDPADRFPVATARVFGMTLVTADRALLASGEVEVLANA